VFIVVAKSFSSVYCSNLSVYDRVHDAGPVARLSARDHDFGTNARITYSIEPGTPLAVDPSSGQVRVVGDLDSLVAQKVNIRVVATDAGTPAMSTTGVLKLVLKHPELDATHHRDQTSRRRAAGNRQQTGSSFWIPLGSVATKPEVACGWRWWKGDKPEVVCGYYWGGGR